ncbi:glycosyltransferase family 2 protein [Mycoplasma anserisalpingitidis]|uniref:Glycosyltransferase family 2 protein n=1 Tax=Mycoplasma anserisalpingitidis TaxID=519450 RepID=A0A5B8JBP5_9MOLU|nr:glycosyltransferase family 2 protein [Mycoplasma anserisalpingitidis]QDY88492.1 glycosyltransferase family 2 protein [Mycoplasma anserisalpingitidis]
MIKKDKFKSSFQPLISILIPTYNITKYFDDTLKSINNQTYKNIEVIISDDNSKDFFYNKLVKKAEKYPDLNIKIYHQEENKGVAFARDFLVEKASGEYIFFLDDDDRLYSRNTLLNIIKYLKPDTEIYSGNFVFAFDAIPYNPHKSNYVNYSIYNSSRALNNSVDYYLKKITFTWGNLFKKDFLIKNNIKFNDSGLRIFEDIASLGKIYFLCSKFQYTNKPTVRYLRRRNSLSNLNIEKFNEKMLFLEQAYRISINQINEILKKQDNPNSEEIINKLHNAKFIEFLNLITQHYLKSRKIKRNREIIDKYISNNILRIKNEIFQYAKLKFFAKNMYYLPIFNKIKKTLNEK